MRTLQSEVWLPSPVEALFAFFSKVENLDTITPAWLRFRILRATDRDIRVGTIIDYRIRLHGVPVRWRTEITAWEPPFRFVDTQLRGPYRTWIHEHTFESSGSGTRVRDRVHYEVPGGILEPLLHRLLVGPDLARIFEYRKRKLFELYGSASR